MFDLVIKNGTVLDGTGSEGFIADLGISDGKIAAIGQELEGLETINAVGKTVTPGFIDIHRHADLAVFRSTFGELELRQGLTTIINGNCGLSAAPFGNVHREEILAYLAPIIGHAGETLLHQSIDSYLSSLGQLPLNVGMLVGAGTLRADVAGYATERLKDRHYSAIHRAMEKALTDGAFGVSLGLGYAPECFYTTQELIHALAPMSGGNMPVTVHMREEGSAVDEAVAEMISVARGLHCPVHISHLKAMGQKNWGKKIPLVLQMLEQARQEGLELTWDVYPYTAGSTQLLHIMPPDLLTGGTDAVCRKLLDPAVRRELSQRLKTGTDFDNISLLVGWENIVMSSFNLPENQRYAGLTVEQIAQMRGQSPDECVFDLLAQERCAITMIDFITSEKDITAILRSDHANVISDSTYPTAGRPHPRLYGTFARVLEKYVREQSVLTLPQAIQKMTSMPAEVLHLPKKGKIAVGYDADINIFELGKIHEAGTYAEPEHFAEGMETVLVGGRAAIRDGKLTGIQNGRVLKSR